MVFYVCITDFVGGRTGWGMMAINKEILQIVRELRRKVRNKQKVETSGT